MMAQARPTVVDWGDFIADLKSGCDVDQNASKHAENLPRSLPRAFGLPTTWSPALADAGTPVSTTAHRHRNTAVVGIQAENRGNVCDNSRHNTSEKN